jgi:hypothetical protein
MIEAAAGCAGGSRFSATQNVIGILGVVLAALLLWVAASYPQHDQLRMRILGRTMIGLGEMLMVAAWVTSLLAAKPDQCGHRHGAEASALPWMALGAAVAIMLGIRVLTSTEWAPVAVLAVADLVLCVLDLLGSYPDRAEIAVLFATHGLCSVTAAWWSRRCRGASNRIRAKASETARILVGGWLIYALLNAASAGAPSTDKPLTQSALAAVFVVTAITAIMGTGYTKYVEAHEDANLSARTIPTAGGRPGALRDTGIRLTRAAAAWAGRYRESF